MGAPAYVENGSIGTAPSQMYGWDGTAPKRLSVDTSGLLRVLDGIPSPGWTTVIDQSGAPSVYVFSYSYLGSLVATKTITISGSTTTISVV